MALLDRVKNAWNAFLNKDPLLPMNVGLGNGYKPDRVRMSRGHERSIVTTVFNRIAIDVSTITLKHIITDEDGRYLSTKDSGLNHCLNVEANIDQTGKAFRLDAVLSMLDEGVVALVPIDTEDAISNQTETINILTMRTGKIIQWYPEHVQVRVYNDRTGLKEDITIRKDKVAIIENPFYTIMNEPNSTLQRLVRKLDLLDVIDEQKGAGKLDLIIQLPYIVKTPARKAQADARRKDIEQQLSSSKYGIAYTDGTEHITQLNRSVDNNIMNQVEYLTSMLFSQLGLTTTILDGTADDTTMNNYYTRTIEPIVAAFAEEINRKFLTQTARSRGQVIRYFRDPFSLVPVTQLAEIADKFTRNEILTANEVRQIVGLAPSKDPNADALRNKNISAAEDVTQYDVEGNVIREGSVEDNEPQNLGKDKVQNG